IRIFGTLGGSQAMISRVSALRLSTTAAIRTQLLPSQILGPQDLIAAVPRIDRHNVLQRVLSTPSNAQRISDPCVSVPSGRARSFCQMARLARSRDGRPLSATTLG